jgi:hypothetical protein
LERFSFAGARVYADIGHNGYSCVYSHDTAGFDGCHACHVHLQQCLVLAWWLMIS